MINTTAIACLLSAAIAGGGAWAWQANSYGAKISDMRSSIAESDKLRALAAATALQAAQVRGETLTRDLLARQQQIERLAKEKRDALNRLTTGRPCLSADAVGVLNGPEGASAGVPAPTGGAAATGGGFATDSDVGGWAADARASHDTCRSRLNALIDWHNKDEK
jgi:hypothetical protein